MKRREFIKSLGSAMVGIALPFSIHESIKPKRGCGRNVVIYDEYAFTEEELTSSEGLPQRNMKREDFFMPDSDLRKQYIQDLLKRREERSSI